MAVRHFLSLDVIPSNNEKILHIFDSSEYADGLLYDCPLLQITTPGFNTPVSITPTKNFNLALNGINLNLIKGSSEELCDLPDGIYIICYSLSPHDKVFVEYNYLRTTAINAQIFKERCKLKLSACEPSEDTHDKLVKLRLIEDYILGAKAKIEYCGEPKAGMDLFNYAKKLLNKFSGGSCC